MKSSKSVTWHTKCSYALHTTTPWDHSAFKNAGDSTDSQKFEGFLFDSFKNKMYSVLSAHKVVSWVENRVFDGWVFFAEALFFDCRVWASATRRDPRHELARAEWAPVEYIREEVWMDQYITEQRGAVLQQGPQNKTGPLLNHCHSSVSQASHMHLTEQG